jgi:hypothetical protein
MFREQIISGAYAGWTWEKDYSKASKIKINPMKKYVEVIKRNTEVHRLPGICIGEVP